jgi:hypothetical protein
MSMFHPARALDVFRTFLGARGLQEATVSVCDGFGAMLDFYRDMQVTGCTFEAADMLLFQWGTYHRPPPYGDGGVFDLGLTRQLIVNEAGEDDDIWQLALNFELESSEQLRALGNSNRWCYSMQELPRFRELVLASAPFTAGCELQIRRRTLDYSCAG